jgi:hypothetical protein
MTLFTAVFCKAELFLTTSSAATNSTNATNCFVMKGTMQILAQAASTTSLATSAMQKELQNAMTQISKQDSSLSDIMILSYLGNTAEDAAIFIGELANAGNTNVGSIETVTNGSPSERKSPVGLVFAIFLPLVVILLLSMLLIKRRSKVKNAFGNEVQSWEEYDPSNNMIRGTGDPPDSYHDGLYHYMNLGTQKYLSTRCTLCLETKRNISSGPYLAALKCNTSTSNLANIVSSQYRNDDWNANDNDEMDGKDEAYQMARARSDMKLGQQHMGMDVHVCQSSTCVRCMANQAPLFVPTGIIRYPKKKAIQEQPKSGTANYIDNSSLSSSVETPSSGNSVEDNHSFETKSTYERDACTRYPEPRQSPKRGRRWYNK